MKEKKDKKKEKAGGSLHQIHIEGINSDGTLALSDSGKTKAHRGDTIEWIIDKGSGVASISAIMDTSEADVFKPNPKRSKVGSKNWQGRINPKLHPIPQEEIYSIFYTKNGGTELFADDPKIQVES